METAYQKYKRIVLEQPEFDDSWFIEAIGNYRGGDESCRRQILGSCLRITLKVIENRFSSLAEDDLLEYIQDANGILEQALASFSGSHAEEFLRHLENRLEDHVATIA